MGGIKGPDLRLIRGEGQRVGAKRPDRSRRPAMRGGDTRFEREKLEKALVLIDEALAKCQTDILLSPDRLLAIKIELLMKLDRQAEAGRIQLKERVTTQIDFNLGLDVDILIHVCLYEYFRDFGYVDEARLHLEAARAAVSSLEGELSEKLARLLVESDDWRWR